MAHINHNANFIPRAAPILEIYWQQSKVRPFMCKTGPEPNPGTSFFAVRATLYKRGQQPSMGR